MLYILSLSDIDKKELEEAHRNHKKPYIRDRCKCILLSFEGFSAKELARLFKVGTRTIYEWIHRYIRSGFKGLIIIPGRGLKALLNGLTIPQIATLTAEIVRNPQSLREVSAVLSEKFGFLITKAMLKKYLKKKMKYTWHRLRKWLKPKQSPEEYARLAAELEILLALEDRGYLKVYFGDESGFSLDPTVPYGWQPSCEYIAMVPEKSPRRNVFGLLSSDNDFEGYDTQGTMNSELIIAFIDDFATRVIQKTVIVLDNATIHHSEAFKEKIDEWQQKDLYIFFLPTYSPHLNLIETLWRKIKYEWLKPQDYLDFDTLTNAVENIILEVGKKYKINFGELKHFTNSKLSII